MVRSVALTALRAYALDSPRLTLVADGWNTTYRVDTADGTRHLLRVHRPAVTAVGQIDTELAWLDALARDTGLPVPRVRRRTDGAPAAVVDGRVCVLLSWTPGRFLDAGLRPVHLERVGRLLADLHAHSRSLSLPATRWAYGVDDRSWRDPDQLGAASVDRLAARAQDAYGEDAGSVVRALLLRVGAVAADLGDQPGEYGLLHGDLHQENFLFTPGGAAAAIDFDDCGVGHDAYDLAVPLAELRHHPRIAGLRAALLAGYRSRRPFSPAAEAALDTFGELKRLQLMFWSIDLREDDWREDVTRSLSRIRTFLAGR